MAVIKISDQDFEEKVLKSGTPVLVDFYADWCGPCKMAEPVIEELSKDYEGKVLFMKINVDENQQSSMKYQIMSIPTTIIFKGGEELERESGFTGRESFEELIKKAISSEGGDNFGS